MGFLRRVMELYLHCKS